MMLIDHGLDGVKVFVPQRWAKHYTDDQKRAVWQHLATLDKNYGERLRTVHVDRLVWEGGLRQRWRVHGTFSFEHA